MDPPPSPYVINSDFLLGINQLNNKKRLNNYIKVIGRFLTLIK